MIRSYGAHSLTKTMFKNNLELWNAFRDNDNVLSQCNCDNRHFNLIAIFLNIQNFKNLK